ncbi:nitrate reductase molybdenum cofactor assembly chaperone [SAR92 clade bacterium H455]|uniref:Nitrate reductase molybdenum cofactor assembly chaperone n=1 Tax=SAR92 clade bacterium H455 TaxID=2974818 RepID=A0ABY5TK19_9GAMM|nr:nitrate reductase molybdenum cofactor assembly chaperone [SAR92 clade bacterium H455]
MQILKLIGCLLDYPDQTVVEHRADIDALVKAADIDPKLRHRLLQFIEQHASQDLMQWQSEYDGLFERGRSLALWLFEHVHGESRDRGQAMVDLVDQYRQAGLEISQHELPDYLPLFLEFLSTQGRDNAVSWLLDMEHILALLQCRLEKRGSDYALLFQLLLSIADSKVDLDEIRQRIADEKRDDSKQAIDKDWEEEEVTFGADSLDKSCGDAQRKPSEGQRKDLDVPLHWVDFETSGRIQP